MEFDGTNAESHELIGQIRSQLILTFNISESESGPFYDSFGEFHRHLIKADLP